MAALRNVWNVMYNMVLFLKVETPGKMLMFGECIMSTGVYLSRLNCFVSF